MSEPYSGRLAFDPDTLYHVSEDGRRVVTDDHGQSWRYAEDGDTSHHARYHQQYAEVNTTATQEAELAYEVGREKAAEQMRAEQPHHYEVQPDDPHFAGVRTDPDDVAAKATSHTDAWRQG